MRRPDEDHTTQPWRVHALARDFDLLDVWRYPVRVPARVSLAEFRAFLDQTLAEMRSGSGLASSLFRFRGWLGRVFGWDGEAEAEGHGEAEDDAALDSRRARLPFERIYRDEFEELSEIENKTVHALMHFGRVALPVGAESREDSDWVLQMAVYVKPRGSFGRAYMSLIGPFRHWIVYPAMMRAVERAWPEHARSQGWLDAEAGG